METGLEISKPLSAASFLQRRGKVVVPLALILLVITVRAGAWFFLRGLPPSNDWINYYNPSAVNLTESGNLRSPDEALDAAPVYVLFLSASYLAFGHGEAAMRVSQIVLDGLVVLLILAIGMRVFSTHVGVLASAAFALYPPAIYMVGLGQPESLLTFCLLAFTLVWVRAREINSRSGHMAAGVILGLGLLMKPNYFGFLPFWALGDWLLSGGERKNSLINFSLAFAGTLIVVGSWYGFRATSPHASTISGVYAKIIYMGSLLRPSLTDGSMIPLAMFYSSGERVLLQQTGQTPAPMEYFRSALRNWLALLLPNPLTLLRFLGDKLFQIWYATDSGIVDKYLRWLQLPLIIVSVGGLISVTRQIASFRRQLPLLFLLSYTVIALLFITPLFREFLPVMPLVMLYAACGLAGLQDVWWRRAR